MQSVIDELKYVFTLSTVGTVTEVMGGPRVPPTSHAITCVTLDVVPTPSDLSAGQLQSLKQLNPVM